ncbi:hypothetical protein AVEN_215482-1 [Araneus ventricosus]|uniref:Uncharacterized protein n=1 Tax=Araneus ventricosus TaxID=182803 RepID=A0A4Y2VM28_ARAVE|nr:hypothetical protein AVEN_215482-1 [Araneus ventricosus]
MAFCTLNFQSSVKYLQVSVEVSLNSPSPKPRLHNQAIAASGRRGPMHARGRLSDDLTPPKLCRLRWPAACYSLQSSIFSWCSGNFGKWLPDKVLSNRGSKLRVIPHKALIWLQNETMF